MASRLEKRARRCKRIDNSLIYKYMSDCLFRFIEQVENTETELYPRIQKDKLTALYNRLTKSYALVEELRKVIDEWKIKK